MPVMKKQPKRKYAKRKPARKPAPRLTTGQLKQVARQVENIELETKYYTRRDSTGLQLDYTTGQVVGLLDAIQQGTTAVTVIGNKIKPVGIRFNYIVGSVGASYDTIRLLMVQFRGPVTAPTLTGMLSSVGNITTPISHYDTDYNDTYKVLHDEVIYLNYPVGPRHKVGSIVIPESKLRRVAIKWNAGVPQLYEDGGLYLFACSDNPPGVNNSTIIYNYRVYYKDA